jgi:hypothetical protein
MEVMKQAPQGVAKRTRDRRAEQTAHAPQRPRLTKAAACAPHDTAELLDLQDSFRAHEPQAEKRAGHLHSIGRQA